MASINESIRLCLFSGVQGSFEIDASRCNGLQSNGPRYYGVMGGVMNLILDVFLGKNKLNCTSVSKVTMGNLDSSTGWYDEESCLYSMQINESDVGFGIIPYPIAAKNIANLPVYMVDNPYMLSKYRVSTKTSSADILSAFFDTFAWEIWVLLALYAFVFWWLFKCHLANVRQDNCRRRQRDDSLYQVLTHLFKVNSAQYEQVSLRVVSFFLALLSFHFLTYFTVSMNTDMVVVNEPRIIRSYDDLLATPRVRLLFPMLVDYTGPFELGEPDSKEHILWQKALKEVGGKKEDLFLKIGGRSFIEMIRLFGNSAFDPNVETVAIIPEAMKGVATKTLCFLKATISFRLLAQNVPMDPINRQRRIRGMTTFSWLSKDPDVNENILTWSYSAFYNTPYTKLIIKRASRMFSLGLKGMFLLQLDRPATDMTTIQNSAEGDTYRRCFAPDYRSNLPHPENAPFKLIHFIVLGYSCLAFLIAATFFLAMEKSRRKLLIKPKPHRKRRNKAQRTTNHQKFGQRRNRIPPDLQEIVNYKL